MTPHRFITREKVTADGEICSEEIICINKKCWEIEECFCIMETNFRARPVYLQTESHIRAHFLTCFISLMVYRLLEKELHEAYTCEEIIDTLKNMEISRPGEKLGYIPVYKRTDFYIFACQKFLCFWGS